MLLRRRLAPRLVTLLLTLTLLPTIVFARDAREQARIDFLIQGVASAKGVTFIRNGSEHDGPAAAKHLRMKVDYAGERVKTAEQFVQYCASKSSITHQKYKVRLADGTTTDAAAYFTAKLQEFDQQHPSH